MMQLEKNQDSVRQEEPEQHTTTAAAWQQAWCWVQSRPGARDNYNDDEGIWGQRMHLQVISKSATLQHQTVRQTRFSQNVFRKNIMMTALPWMITTKTLQ